MKELELHVQNNITIALFMGAVQEEWYPSSEISSTCGLHIDYRTKDNFPENARYYSVELLKYHCSADWILPVVKVLIPLIEETPEGKVFKLQIIYFLLQNNIKQVQLVVVEAIEIIFTKNLEQAPF